MGFAANWKKTIYYLRRNGWKRTFYAVQERLKQQKEAPYHYEEPSEEALLKQRKEVHSVRPFFSILVPLYRTPEAYLREMAESVLNQSYPEFELILADATEDQSVEAVVRTLMEEEEPRFGRRRIVYERLLQNSGISENTNAALRLAKGEYVGLLDHDDVLTPDALYHMAKQIRQSAEKGVRPLLLYSDEDKCNSDRTVYFEPHYKTDFNLELLLSNNYICHFLVMDRELLCKVGFRKAYDGAQDFDLVLRAVNEILPEEETIIHIPKVLYHWRCHTASTAENPQSKQYAYEAGKRAVQDFADRKGWKAEAQHLQHLGFYRLQYLPDLLSVREDVAAVGGSLYAGGRLIAGGYDLQGKVLHQGLQKGFSGYMHRGVLTQDAAAVDIRLIAVKEQYRPLFEQVTGVPYVTTAQDSGREGVFDRSTLPQDTDWNELSIRLGEALRREGVRICWDPSWSRNLSWTEKGK